MDSIYRNSIIFMHLPYFFRWPVENICSVSFCFEVWNGCSIIGPFSFFYGMPFPIGLQAVSDEVSSYIPWVWGINGVASVIAPVLGSLLSVCFGFRIVIGISLLLYIIAGWIILHGKRC